MAYGDQYPISRNDICGLDFLGSVTLSLTSGKNDDVEGAIKEIGRVIFENSTRVNLNDDVFTLSQFSLRVGMEVMTEAMRVKHYYTNCWIFGPRDSDMLTFKEGGKNCHNTVDVDPVIRNAAMALYFSYPLSHDPAFSVGAKRIREYIDKRDLWSEQHAARVSLENCRRAHPSKPLRDSDAYESHACSLSYHNANTRNSSTLKRSPI